MLIDVAFVQEPYIVLNNVAGFPNVCAVCVCMCVCVCVGVYVCVCICVCV